MKGLGLFDKGRNPYKKSKNEMYSLIGYSSLFSVISLWIFAFIVTIYVTFPHICNDLDTTFKYNKKSNNVTFIEIILILIFSFMQILVFKSIYKVHFVNSYLSDEYRLKIVVDEKNNSNIKSETCKKCDKIRQVKDKHCSICDSCVIQYDHHCIVLNSCIGKYNYKYYFAFLVQSFILVSMYIFVNAISILYYITELRVKINKLKELDDSKLLESETLDTKSKIYINSSLDFIATFPVRASFVLLFGILSWMGLLYLIVINLLCINSDQTACERKYKIKYCKSEKNNNEVKSEDSDSRSFEKDKNIIENNQIIDLDDSDHLTKNIEDSNLYDNNSKINHSKSKKIGVLNNLLLNIRNKLEIQNIYELLWLE